MALAGSALARDPLFNDEASSLGIVGRSLGGLFSVFPEEHNGILFDLLLWPVVQLGGTSEAWLRAPSLACFAGAIVVCGLVGARLLGRTAGVLAALLLALSPFARAYAHEARTYSLTLLLAGLALLTLLRALDRPSRRRWLAYLAGVAALGYAHDFGLLTVLAHPVLLWRAPRERRRELLLALVGAAVLLAPLGVLAALDYGSEPLSWLPEPSWTLVRLTAIDPASGGAVALALGLALIAVALGVAVRAPARAPAVSAAAALLVVPTLALVLLSIAHPFFWGRYVLPSVVGVSLLGAAGAAWPGRLRWAPILAVGALAGLLGAAPDDAGRIVANPDWAKVAALVEQERQPQDAFLFVGPDSVATIFLYHAPSFGFRRDRLPWTEQEMAELPPPLYELDYRGGGEDRVARAFRDNDVVWVLDLAGRAFGLDTAIDPYVRDCDSGQVAVVELVVVRRLTGCRTAG